MEEISQVYTTSDGSTFATKAEAQDYLRRPKIQKAFEKITDDNEELTTWLLDNKDVVDNAFEAGTIRRVTKSDKKKLLSALETAKELFDTGESKYTKLRFLAENVENIHDGFRYPTQKRLSDEEKEVAAKNTLMAETENEELSDWIIAHKDKILECYQAGVEKRVVSPKAAQGLAAYRVKKAEEKVENLKEALSELKAAKADKEAIAEAEEAVVEAQGKLEEAKSALSEVA